MIIISFSIGLIVGIICGAQLIKHSLLARIDQLELENNKLRIKIVEYKHSQWSVSIKNNKLPLNLNDIN